MYSKENFGTFNPSHSYQPSYGPNTDTMDNRGKYNLNQFPVDYSKPFDSAQAPYDLSKPYESNSVPVEYNKQYGMHYTQNMYGKPYGDTQKLPTYASENSAPSDYSSNNANGQFFQGSQSNTYEKSYENSVFPTEYVDGNHPSQSSTYVSKNTYNADYPTKNIEELKTQVNSLQNIINSLNYSGYAKKPEDQQTIANLEQQINELKGKVFMYIYRVKRQISIGNRVK